ncbi:MAG: hypothetical protein KAX49_19725 [Halanaerobiales bacterium]|nr:hypothetical protein [Halanaerobiales bacterium]
MKRIPVLKKEIMFVWEKSINQGTLYVTNLKNSQVFRGNKFIYDLLKNINGKNTLQDVANAVASEHSDLELEPLFVLLGELEKRGVIDVI